MRAEEKELFHAPETTEEIKHLSLLAMMTLWTTILGQKGIYYPVAVLTLY